MSGTTGAPSGRRISKAGWILLSAAGLAVVAAMVAAVPLYHRYYDHKVSNFTSRCDLYVVPGTTTSELLQYIVDSTSVVNASSLRRAFAEVFGQDAGPVPGHYTLGSGESSVYVARMLQKGWQTPVPLVLSGTMRSVGGIARKISRQMLMDSTTVDAALRDPELLSRYGTTPRDMFCLILPDTYQVYWTDDMAEVLSRLQKAYDAFWTPENVKKASALGLGQREVGVLASIVAAESNKEAEQPSIAAVYLNRLRKGMPLQADPTIAFVKGYSVNRILKRDLEIDSPYNTYRNQGLPPGPICVPTRSALASVLNPDVHDYLYFCASDALDGTHRFASSYTEHLRNAAAYQKALDKRGIKK